MIANEKFLSMEYKDFTTTTNFAPTKLISTYLYAFVAGHYAKVDLKDTHHNIPMSVYVKESMLVHVENLIDFLGEVTNKSMAFYETNFGFLYPFSKFDQVFCSEYKWSAMENAVKKKRKFFYKYFNNNIICLLDIRVWSLTMRTFCIARKWTARNTLNWQLRWHTSCHTNGSATS